MATLQQQFAAFSKFGDSRSDGTVINLTQSDKWLKQANVVDGKKVTTNDTCICFSKFKAKTLKYADFVRYIEQLCQDKRLDVEDVKEKLSRCGPPSTAGGTEVAKDDVVRRLTDTTKYTGMHKVRSNSTGQGQGVGSSEYIEEYDGYVQGYKNKNTWDKKHSQNK